jgi:hypothetical protein
VNVFVKLSRGEILQTPANGATSLLASLAWGQNNPSKVAVWQSWLVHLMLILEIPAQTLAWKKSFVVLFASDLNSKLYAVRYRHSTNTMKLQVKTTKISDTQTMKLIKTNTILSGRRKVFFHSITEIQQVSG